MSSLPRPSYWMRHLLRQVASRDEWLLVRHRLDEDAPPLGALPPGFRLLHGQELLLGYPDWPARTERIRARLADARQVGLGLAWEDALAYDTWIWVGAYPEPNTGILLDPGPGGGVLLDSWAAPAHRGKGLHAAMLLHRLAEAHHLGLRTLDGLVLLQNTPALTAQRGAGAELLIRYVCRHVLGLRVKKEKQVSWDELDRR